MQLAGSYCGLETGERVLFTNHEVHETVFGILCHYQASPCLRKGCSFNMSTQVLFAFIEPVKNYQLRTWVDEENSGPAYDN